MNKLCCVCEQEFRLPPDVTVPKGERVGFALGGRTSNTKGPSVQYKYAVSTPQGSICPKCGLKQLKIILEAHITNTVEVEGLLAGRNFGKILRGPL